MTPRLIVHGGAWNIPDAYDDAHLAGVTAAAEAGYQLLREGGAALDSVELAVRTMEADPTFDAGYGAFLNIAGEVELDAMIMDGRTLDVGAVAAVQNLLHPVQLARAVMEQTEHAFLVGKGALQFAKQIGMEELDPKALLTKRELQFYEAIKKDPTFYTKRPFELDGPSDTVGAVALDQQGNIAAATSTGGTARKMVGRVGDSPIPGAGGYADNMLGGVSATGWGEAIFKVLLSKRVCDAFADREAMAAARDGVRYLAERVQGLGGVVGIRNDGRYAFAHNTPKMAFAYIGKDGLPHAFLSAAQ
jgi:beta-aspartyl-peptidase (threonine type)